jgi:hypothetical protein
MLVPAMKFISVLMWSYAVVLAAVWVRRVARTPRSEHVGHFLELLAGLVPLSCAAVALVLVGGVIGLPSVVGFLFVFLPVGVVVALHFEVRRIEEARPDLDRVRVLLGLGLATAVLVARGGV